MIHSMHALLCNSACSMYIQLCHSQFMQYVHTNMYYIVRVVCTYYSYCVLHGKCSIYILLCNTLYMQYVRSTCSTYIAHVAQMWYKKYYIVQVVHKYYLQYVQRTYSMYLVHHELCSNYMQYVCSYTWPLHIVFTCCKQRRIIMRSKGDKKNRMRSWFEKKAMDILCLEMASQSLLKADVERIQTGYR